MKRNTQQNLASFVGNEGCVVDLGESAELPFISELKEHSAQEIRSRHTNP